MLIIQSNDEASGYLHWKPLTTTVAYIPLEDDIAEKTGNSSFTNNNVTNTTINGVKCGYFNGGAYLLTNISAYTNINHTICCWYKNNGGYNSWVIGANPCGVLKGDGIGLGGDKYTYECYTGNSSWTINSGTLNTSEWHCLVYTGGKLYIDGVLQGSNSGSYNGGTVYNIGGHTSGNSCANRYITGYMGDVVIDSATWTESQVLDYYNKTKGRYGF